MTCSKGGAGDGIRTRDIDLGKVALYQLSYSRFGEFYCRAWPRGVSIQRTRCCIAWMCSGPLGSPAVER